MQTITTYNGITLGFVEIPKDAYDIRYKIMPDNTKQLVGTIKDDNRNIGTCYIRENPIGEIIGTTSTLTNEQVKELIKDFTFTKGVSGDNWYKCGTLNEFLDANNIDTSKEYVILNLLKNEQTN